MSMIKTWRWYGEHDAVELEDIRQTGVSHLVTSLSKIPYGAEWTVEAITERKQLLENNGFKWYVTESVPVHEDIKTRSGDYQKYIENYKKSLENLASCGIHIVCYNFMPVMDWTRTSLHYQLKSGALTLRFEHLAFVAFDLYILKREGAENEYNLEICKKAKLYYEQLTEEEREALTLVFIDNLPGTDEKYSIPSFKKALSKYKNIDKDQLKKHLSLFLKEIIPVAEKCGIKMCIHPDDPPFPLLGLPRIVSTEADIADLFSAVESENNGLTFCTGSFGVRPDNDLPGMFRRFAPRIHFIHLRSTQRDQEGNFHEANHLEGDVDMYAVITEVIKEQERRKACGRTDSEIPMRPDHGHLMLDDRQKEFYPGYSCIGRLKGLAELTGLEYGIEKAMNIK